MKDLLGEEVTATGPVKIMADPCEQIRFLVATWYSPQKYWKLWRTEFFNSDAAKKWAENDVANVRGHTHYVILKIKFPGAAATPENEK